jgi:hypothetical protein
MSLDLLKDIFLYGNLDLVYNSSDIKKVDFKVFNKYLDSVTFFDRDKSFPWRFYHNMEFIINSYEVVVLKDEKKSKDFIDIFYQIITKYLELSKHKKFVSTVSLENIKDYSYILVNLLVRKIHTKLNLYQKNKDYFYIKLSNFEADKPFHYYLDYSSPYDYIKWSSNWKLVSRGNELVLYGIDIYLDSYFKNNNIYYNEYMENDIKLLSDRIFFLKEFSPSYLEILRKNITNVTEKLYCIFPYNKVYKDYKKLLFLDKDIYHNKYIKTKEEFTDVRWLFSILPDFLSAYLLGFPIISLDVPGEKIIKKYIKYMEEKENYEEYYKWFSENFNKKYLSSIEFESKIGNGSDDEESVDLCYIKIKDYNQDDIVSIFNNNIMHHFSCKEFETILRKEENPYNRDKVTNLRKIIDNLKFKKKIRKNLLIRGLELELNGTMIENYQEVIEKIQDQNSRVSYSYTQNDIEHFYRPLLDIFLRQNTF